MSLVHSRINQHPICIRKFASFLPTIAIPMLCLANANRAGVTFITHGLVTNALSTHRFVFTNASSIDASNQFFRTLRVP